MQTTQLRVAKVNGVTVRGLAQYVVRDQDGRQVYPKQVGKTETFMSCQQYVEREQEVEVEW